MSFVRSGVIDGLLSQLSLFVAGPDAFSPKLAAVFVDRQHRGDDGADEVSGVDFDQRHRYP